MAKRKKDNRKRKKFPSPKEMWAMMRMTDRISAIIPDKQRKQYVLSLINDFDRDIAEMDRLGVEYLIGV